jgi:NADH-quinone oxidoreductase subunit D/NADH-quinone oxidoreductase subunit C/D
MSVETLTVNQSLSDYFQGMIVPDSRKGYEGYIVNQQDLVKFSRSLRDDLGYDYLSSVTGVDYLPEGKIEVVYHAYRSTGGSALVFKVQVLREDPMVPSLVSVYPGVEFQEREAWDLLGIRFTDHPDLRRILCPEDWAGHPLRKDYQMPAEYHGIPAR